MIGDTEGCLLLVGTIWPLVTFPAMLVAAVALPRKYRRYVLFIAPILLVPPCILFVDELANNSNLLFAVTLGLAIIGWGIYYVMLTSYGLVKHFRRTNSDSGKR